jgi:predicted flap endonuclease-1-like 5' DNA nuclease
MFTVAQDNLVPIVIALLVGIAIGWWIFKRGRALRDSRPAAPELLEASAPPAAPAAAPERRLIRDGIDTVEGRGIADEHAAATMDVAGEILGVDAHPDLGAGPADDLQALKGVGPKLAAQLRAQGITRFAQLAALTDTEIEMLDAKMGAFRGRIARDRLAEQSAYLARGDTDGFEARFGKLGGKA